MKKIILLLAVLSSGAFANDLTVAEFKENLSKKMLINRILFDCVSTGEQLNQIYENAQLIESATVECENSIKNALSKGITQEDIQIAISK